MLTIRSLLAGIALAFASTQAHAAIIIYSEETAGDVVFTYSGGLDVTGTAVWFDSPANGGSIEPALPQFGSAVSGSNVTFRQNFF